MTQETLIPDAIIEDSLIRPPKKMGAPAQLQVRSSFGRMVAVEQIRAVTAQAIMKATVSGVSQTAALREAIRPHEAGLTAINDNVAEAARIGENNAAMLILQESQATAAEFVAIARRGRERLATMPDAAFVELTLADRFGAWKRGTHAELEVRPGTPRLTFWQDVKQLVVCGVVERICDEYDREQMLERKEELARAVTEQMELLEAQMAAAGLAGAQEDSTPTDEDTVTRLIDDVLARTHSRTKNVEYVEVA